MRADTREKVLRAMERLGYSPNRAAQALRRGSFRTIGVVTQHIERTGEALTTEGVLAAAWRAGYTVSMIQVERPASRDMRTAVLHLAHQGVDGLVVVQAGRADSRHLVLPADVPVAVSDSALVGYYPSASADQVRGTRAAVDHRDGNSDPRVRSWGGLRPQKLPLRDGNSDPRDRSWCKGTFILRCKKDS